VLHLRIGLPKEVAASIGTPCLYHRTAKKGDLLGDLYSAGRGLESVPVPGKWGEWKTGKEDRHQVMAIFLTPLYSYANASKYVIWDSRAPALFVASTIYLLSSAGLPRSSTAAGPFGRSCLRDDDGARCLLPPSRP
jgi:hypothetical protein